MALSCTKLSLKIPYGPLYRENIKKENNYLIKRLVFSSWKKLTLKKEKILHNKRRMKNKTKCKDKITILYFGLEKSKVLKKPKNGNTLASLSS